MSQMYLIDASSHELLHRLSQMGEEAVALGIRPPATKKATWVKRRYTRLQRRIIGLLIRPPRRSRPLTFSNSQRKFGVVFPKTADCIRACKHTVQDFRPVAADWSLLLLTRPRQVLARRMRLAGIPVLQAAQNVRPQFASIAEDSP